MTCFYYFQMQQAVVALAITVPMIVTIMILWTVVIEDHYKKGKP
jgi:hypothetical protein